MQEFGKVSIQYLFQCVVASLTIGGFFVTVSFLAAKPASSFDLHGKKLPVEWEAAVPNHGGYYEWYLPESHLGLLVAGILMWLGVPFALYVFRKTQVLQFLESETRQPAVRLIGRVLACGAALFTACWFMSRVGKTMHTS